MEEIWEVYDKFREKTGKVIQRNSNERLKDGEYNTKHKETNINNQEKNR
mgnify:CR=1 FL=1